MTDALLGPLDAEVLRGTFGAITSIVAAQRGRVVHETYPEGDAATLRNTLPLGLGATRAALMQGNGGNKVAVLPDPEAVAVITSTNFNTPGMHAWTDTILVDHLLPVLAG